MRSLFALTLLCLSGLTGTVRADDPKPSWDSSQPPGPERIQAIDVEEGTWMNLDVSPDGEEIIFDLLGDLYIMPIQGCQGDERPRRLTQGIDWDMQPRFSPDGSWIAFTSDRRGKSEKSGDNIWIMRRDGSDVRQVTNETYRLLNNPTWSPDGNYLVARKHFTARRSLGSGEMWMYHRAAADANAMEGVQLTKKPNEQKDVNEPIFSRDGKYLYYSQDTTPGDAFEYDKDSNKQIYTVRRLNLESGEIDTLISGPGGACRPVPSPDGKQVAFVRRVGAKTGLHVIDLESGATRLIYDALERDMQEAWAIHGVYTGYNWTPDGESIVIWAKGKIHRIQVADGSDTILPFHVTDERSTRTPVRFPIEVAPEQFPVKMLRWVQVSPAGNQVVFQALGYLYVKDLPDGTPRRLTQQSEHFEFYPSYSPDGRHIVYTTWNDQKFGSIRVCSADADEGESWKVTSQPGHYLQPVFAPDGLSIAYVKGTGGFLRSALWSREPGIYTIPTKGGEPTLVNKGGESPMFAADSERLYFTDGAGGAETDNFGLYSIRLDGKEKRQHFNSQWATDYRISPDGKWVAFIERFHVYVAPLISAGKSIDIGPKTTAIPIGKVSQEAGNWVHFSGDSQHLHWALGPTLYTTSLNSHFKFLREGEDPGQETLEATPQEQAIGFEAPFAKPSQVVALVGGTVMTMGDSGTIKNATILIRDNRIEAVGPKSDIAIPEGATVINIPGLVVTPGFIDTHAHGSFESGGLMPQANWVNYARLAFGITTIHDPSNDSASTFAASEMGNAGVTTAPRTFSTGTILYGATGSFKAEIDSLEDAKFHLRRMKAIGAWSVKSYNQPRRDQRQQVIAAARELEMMVVPEGGSTFMHNLTMIVDGHTGIEHTLPVQSIYQDVLDLWRGTEVGYTPTLCVAYGGISGERYWYAEDNLWEHPRLNRFIPKSILHPRSRRREKAPLEDYNHIRVAEIAKQVVEQGGIAQTGGHGQLNGIDTHWEMWSFVQGGMSPADALRCGTIFGAKYLGLDRDLGSIEAGKLADLVVYERGRDPSKNIRETERIEMVMSNGRLFDAASMREMTGAMEAEPHFYFEDGDQDTSMAMPRVRGCDCSRPGGLPAWMIETE